MLRTLTYTVAGSEGSKDVCSRLADHRTAMLAADSPSSRSLRFANA